jgi:hypothetical protein
MTGSSLASHKEPGGASYVIKCAPRISSASSLRVVNDFASWIVHHSTTSSTQPKAQVYVLVVEEIPLVEAADRSKYIATKKGKHSGDPLDIQGTVVSRIIRPRPGAEEL